MTARGGVTRVRTTGSEDVMEMLVTSMESPIGTLALFERDGAVVAVAFEGAVQETRRWLARRFGALGVVARHDDSEAAALLRAYFDGDLAALDRIRVDTGGTPFQRAVWSALRRIPAGRTASYSELAAAVGRPSAVRAVGAANGSNPVPVIVPCHRVIAADGTLCGYGGGLDRKRWLLEHEGAPAPVRRIAVRAAQATLW